jgi:hypothetical protein
MPTKNKIAKSTKGVSKQALVCASGEQCFWVTDGRVISNLAELHDALKVMNSDVFAHHVNKEKNDFANWIADILGDADLAQNLRSAKKPNTACAIVARRLKSYDV